jgi:membrane-associated phospholipid phosphatase
MELKDKKERSFSAEIYTGFRFLLRSWQFYAGAATMLLGMILNFASQTYLHNYMEEGKTLPMLSDLILDNIPLVDVSLYYDLLSLSAFLLMLAYIVFKNEYRSLPFFLLICGIFYLTRGVFIVLTPFGNPPNFNGSNGPFNGFSKYELGVYPSGHVGSAFLFLLMIKDKLFKWLISACLVLIIITLLLSRGHYSIDIFSGLFFAYAIKSFGDKYFANFDFRGKGIGILPPGNC